MAETLLKREQIPKEMTWDETLLYPSQEAWEQELASMKTLAKAVMETYQGKIDTPEMIVACVKDLEKIRVLSDHLGGYIELLTSVDHYNTEHMELGGRFAQIEAEIFSELSLIESELSAQPEESLRVAEGLCEHGKAYIRKLLRFKPHQLNPETEKVLAAFAPSFLAPIELYETAKLADIQFEDFEVNGSAYPLGYSLFEDDYQYEANPEIRRAAFDAFSKKIRQYQHVTGNIYNTQVQNEKIESKLRGFESVFDYLLFDQQVSRELYDRQVDLIMEKLAPHMRRYAKLLKKAHGLEKMTYADLKITLDPEFDPQVTIEESKQYTKKGLAVLGQEYQKLIDECYQKRWVDFANNQGKQTGGFCMTPYQKNSFILLSWNEKMSDVFTLAHEIGHAGHFDLCHKEQSFFDSDVSCYFVEAPSTMNEMLLTNYLMSGSQDPRFKRWVLASLVGNTYFHNFVTHGLEAVYQREVYKIVDAGGTLHADLLNEIFQDVLQKFWGDEVEINEGAELTWMRQPHYYMGLYPYTYSAGLTVATEVSRRILKEGKPAVEDWIKVLKAGGTKDPVGLARLGGVDITTDQPLLHTIEYIGSLITEMEILTKELEA